MITPFNKANYFLRRDTIHTSVATATILVLVIFLLAIGNTFAQDTTALDRYIQQAIDRNRTLIERNLQVNKSRTAVQKARGNFMPDLNFEATYDQASGGRTIDVPVGDLVNPINTAINNLAGENLLPTNLGTVKEPILADNFQETKIRIMQPLFNTDIYFGYKAQKQQLSADQARRNAFINELTKEVKVAYYNYLKTKELMQIHRSTRTLLEEILAFNKDLVKFEKATSDLVSSARFEISELESQIAETERQRSNARSFFNFLLNRPLSTPIEIDTNIVVAQKSYSLIQLQQTAIDHREELMSLRHGIEAHKQLQKLEKGDALPELFTVFDVGFQGFGYEFADDQDFWFLRFGMRWNLFEGFKNRADIQRSTIEIKMLDNQYSQLKDRIKMEVINKLAGYRAAQKNLEARRASLKSAKDRFQIIRSRYRQNQSLFIDLLDARTNFTNAKLQRTVAKFDLKIRHAELQQAIGRY